MTVRKDYHRRSHVPEHLPTVHSGIDVPSRRKGKRLEINSPEKILKAYERIRSKYSRDQGSLAKALATVQAFISESKSK